MLPFSPPVWDISPAVPTQGVQVVKDLVACSDILVENFVPGMLDRFGLGYDDCAALNDRISASRVVMFRGGTRGAWFLELTSRTLAMICPPPWVVYASLSGYGGSGPMREVPGFDVIASAVGGLMGITGPPSTAMR